ncbi:gelsolin-like protein 2 [Acropora millepora]|uniref:gelsolin-like protein 2 n=1 Tax=Acropora millepora TaxID=45264 RepID=UPI001CF14425|nr:gelsolin-like protein 2 [Acropora millepora]
MSGLRKAKNYDWKDSNLALFGSDIEKNVKKAAAETEKAWKGAGEKPGLEIWRIVKFEVKDWPKEDYGKFFSGDSYIILNTYKDKESDELLYDVHFWIGKESSQDEYGTAAYKTVELDTFLNDKPVQHREVMKQESSLFKSYFEDMVIMSGGAESGFRRVGPKEYHPRLLKFNDEGRNKVKMTECTYCKESVTPDNVYIIDNGLTLYQVNLVNIFSHDKDERMKAAQFVMKLKSERGNCKSEVLDDDFNKTAKLPSGDPSQDLEEPGDDDFTKTIFKLSDESGHLTFTDMGTFSKGVLSSDDVFVCDNGKTCLVYVGKKASIEERRKGMEYAHNYLLKTKHPLIPVTVMQEGQKSEVFDTLF